MLGLPQRNMVDGLQCCFLRSINVIGRLLFNCIGIMEIIYTKMEVLKVSECICSCEGLDSRAGHTPLLYLYVSDP